MVCVCLCAYMRTFSHPDVSDSWLFHQRRSKTSYLDVKSRSGDRDTSGKHPRFARYAPFKLPPWAFSRIVSLEGSGICLRGRTRSHAGPRRRATWAEGTPRWGLQGCHGQLHVRGLPGNTLSELPTLRPGLPALLLSASRRCLPPMRPKLCAP